jgi:CDP-diacylglycerol--glycerol-3-phosphate 3-phosphatidyltransferase
MSDTKTKITDPSRILTVANMISLLRAFLALPIIYTLQYSDWRLWTFILILIAVISDMLDGFFARRAHEVTHFGKWMDPIADFICLTTVTYYLVLNNMFPMWFFSVYVFRYVSIAILAIYLINHSGFVISANWYGKWASGITVLTTALHIFTFPFLDWVRILSLYTAFFLLLISWMIYLKSIIINLKSIAKK